MYCNNNNNTCCKSIAIAIPIQNVKSIAIAIPIVFAILALP
jgi:hypothetical protein